MNMGSNTQEEFLAVAEEIGRTLSDLKEYVVRHSDRISPMLPGGTPKSSYPPPADEDEQQA
jgi:hypothetical protein